jgi:hypothetical protein
MVMIDLAVRPDVREQMALHFRTQASGPLMEALTQLLKESTFDHFLESWALSATSSQVRARAMAALLAEAVVWTEGYRFERTSTRRVANLNSRPLTVTTQPEKLIAAAAADRSVLVRRAGASGLVSLRHRLKDPLALAALYLSDRSPSVRQRAEWVVEQMGKTECQPVAP